MRTLHPDDDAPTYTDDWPTDDNGIPRMSAIALTDAQKARTAPHRADLAESVPESMSLDYAAGKILFDAPELEAHRKIVSDRHGPLSTNEWLYSLEWLAQRATRITRT